MWILVTSSSRSESSQEEPAVVEGVHGLVEPPVDELGDLLLRVGGTLSRRWLPAHAGLS